MKKDLMAREAARLLEGSNWLAEPLRFAGDNASVDASETVTGNLADETALDGDTAELPAFLADPASEESSVVDEDTDQLEAAE
jgi:ParB family chromosome partitioning protein